MKKVNLIRLDGNIVCFQLEERSDFVTRIEEEVASYQDSEAPVVLVNIVNTSGFNVFHVDGSRLVVEPSLISRRSEFYQSVDERSEANAGLAIYLEGGAK